MSVVLSNRLTSSATISNLYRSHHLSFPGLDRVTATYHFGPRSLFRGANNWAAARLHEIEAKCPSAEAKFLTFEKTTLQHYVLRWRTVILRLFTTADYDFGALFITSLTPVPKSIIVLKRPFTLMDVMEDMQVKQYHNSIIIVGMPLRKSEQYSKKGDDEERIGRGSRR